LFLANQFKLSYRELRAKLEHKVAEQARHEKRLADQRDAKHSETAAPAVTAAAVQLVAVK
jgi:hypothetical protein